MSKSFSIKFPSIGCSEPKAFDRLSTDYGKLRAESVQALRATGVQDAESHLETYEPKPMCAVHRRLMLPYRLAITKLATARKEGFPEDWKTKHSLTYGGALLSQLLDAATEMLPAQEHTAFALKAFNL